MNVAGFVKNSFIDYPSKISSVVFTRGCNFNCHYCHNRQLIDNTANIIDNNEIFEFLQTRRGLIDAVVVSGGEPTLQKDLVDFIKQIKSLGFLIKLDTNGTNFEMLKDLVNSKLIDYVAMDIKAPFNKYDMITNQPFNFNIKKSVDFLLTDKVDYEFRTTLSPKLTIDDIVEISKSIMGAKTFFLQKCNLDNYETENIFNKQNIEKIQNNLKKNVKNCILRGF